MIYLFSLLLILTAAFWFLRWMGIFKTCPVCAAAFLTWIIGLALLYSGITWADPIFIAILIGATIGAVAEKYGREFGFVWKTALILLGTSGVYFLASQDIGRAVIVFAALAVVTAWFNFPSGKTKTLVDRFKNCC